MASIFASTPGRVVRIPTSYPAVRTTMQFSDAARFDYTTLGCVITEAAVRQRGNFQVLRSVSDLIYIDTFGDDVSEISVSGLAFLETCETNASGIDNFLDYYSNNRIAARKTPVGMLFGTKLFQGFLINSEAKIADPEMGLGLFSLQFLAVSKQQASP